MDMTQLGNQEAQALSQTAVLHIPHSSRLVPAEDRQTILLGDAALNNELLRMTDTYTDELFPITPAEAGRVIFPLSRLSAMSSDFLQTSTSRWRLGEWVSLTLVHRWVECFERSRIQRIVRSV